RSLRSRSQAPEQVSAGGRDHRTHRGTARNRHAGALQRSAWSLAGCMSLSSTREQAVNQGDPAMNGATLTWAVVLAACEGTRLASLTRDAAGNAVPKQFCSLNGGRSLIQDAIQRARQVVTLERTCAIVAEQHAHHWRQALRSLPTENIIV